MSYKLGENSPLFQKQKESGTSSINREGKKLRGRPRNEALIRGKSIQEGLTAEYARTTYLMKVELAERVKDYAYTERIDIKTAINKLVANALTREEKRLVKEGGGVLKRNRG